ncbi:CUB and sushi domain-containing protein 1-like isoform X2 [Halichondria panicea]|uniref:CUB and sushi domain-containing protein 1-like isoform X2 n=1 Tax=Halichondria panicea TaxID=6063 RepID=UPI00312B7568
MATVTLFLCCLLESVSLVYGQPLTHLAAGNEPLPIDHTGEIISFSDIGTGTNEPFPWYCFTQNTTNVEWQLPNGTAVVARVGVPVGDELITRAVNGGLFLLRGTTHFSPDGEHCCVRIGTTQRLCVTFTPCPTLSPLTDTNGTISYNATNNMATYTCDTGYTISGATPITCMSDGTSAGTWSPPPPTCTIVTCPVLTSPTNGVLSTTSRDYLTIAAYSCDTGYILTGTAARTCQATGEWSRVAPFCSPVDCGPPTNPSNGAVDKSTGTTFMMTATYTCNTGYNIVGSESRTCGVNGTSGATTLTDGVWSPAAPTCEIVNCGSLDAPSNGTVDTSSGTTYLRRANYTCNPGYTLTGGEGTRTCQANGMWSSSDPACEFIVLSIGGTVYTNNTALSFSLIGEGSSALTCHTELSTCCREQDNPNGGALGGWRGPDGGVSVPSEAAIGTTAEGFYVTRGISTISLNRRCSETNAGGVYCCTIPRAGGITQTFCVDVQSPISEPPLTEPASTYITVTLGVLLAVAVAVIIVLITFVIIGRKQLTQARCINQLKQAPNCNQKASYENVTVNVGVSPTAVELSECPAAEQHYQLKQAPNCNQEAFYEDVTVNVGVSPTAVELSECPAAEQHYQLKQAPNCNQEAFYEDVTVNVGVSPTAVELSECPAAEQHYVATNYPTPDMYVSGGGQERKEEIIYDNV